MRGLASRLRNVRHARREHGNSAVIVALSMTVMMSITAIAIEYSKAVSHRIDLQANVDQATLELAAMCADTSSGLDCNNGAAMKAKAQELILLNDTETTVNSVIRSGDTVTIVAEKTQDAQLLSFVDSSDTVTETVSATAGWQGGGDQVPIAGPTTPFALDYCTWQRYNPESGTVDPGSIQNYGMLADNTYLRLNQSGTIDCTGVPGFANTTRIAGLDHEMLWITWDKGDVTYTAMESNCELAFKADAINIARDAETSLPNFAAADDGWYDVRDRECTGDTLQNLHVGKVLLMPIMALEPTEASWRSNRSWELMLYSPYYAPTFRVVGYAPFEITGFLNPAGNPSNMTCNVHTGVPIPYHPSCSGVQGRFVTSTSSFDGWEYGDPDPSGGISNLGNTAGNVSLID